MTESKAVQIRQSNTALAGAVATWASSTTDPESDRRLDLVRDKTRVVGAFFEHVDKHPAQVSPIDVSEWIGSLEDSGLAAATVYAMASKVSSWYRWAMQDAQLAEMISHNPVTLARPKAPKAYNSAEALSDAELERLLAAVPRHALTGKRDYAMLLFYVLTGHRRAEVCRLTWGDLKLDGAQYRPVITMPSARDGTNALGRETNWVGMLTVRFLNKGGDYQSEEVSPACWEALQEYLQAAGRLDAMTADSPLWVGHDRAGQAAGALSSHSFSKNLKRYAKLAGIGDIHVHQLRHTVARMVGEDAGDLGAVQQVLGHKNQATTRIYAKRIMVKQDKHSAAIAARLGL